MCFSLMNKFLLNYFLIFFDLTFKKQRSIEERTFITLSLSINLFFLRRYITEEVFELKEGKAPTEVKTSVVVVAQQLEVFFMEVIFVDNGA
eukprot:TRINITY_DN4754_c0_g1_i1.p1 TRINITY_DN4754_c0_g1~~TRINITY_DN4754_c0_g1_i1.p1  ORF type:complete len:91 (+),score=7.59 TRINITY_DN4754_c0_g1_i1:107-379(+)